MLQSFPPLRLRLAFASPFRLSCLLALACALALAPAAHAQQGVLVPPVAVANSATHSGTGAGVAGDLQGNIYMPTASGGIIKVTPGGTVTTPVSSSSVTTPVSVALDSAGDIWVADYGAPAVVEFNSAGTLLHTYTLGSSDTPIGVAVGPGGSVAAISTTALYVLAPGSSAFSTVANSGIGTATAVAFAPNGDLYVADGGGPVLDLFPQTSAGVYASSATVFAGTGVPGSGSYGDGGPATSAAFNLLLGLTVDASGNVYVLDEDGSGDGVVRRISADGNIITIAGQYGATPGCPGPNTGSCQLATATVNNVYGIVPQQFAAMAAPGPASEVIPSSLTSTDLTNTVGFVPDALTMDALGRLLLPRADGSVLAIPTQANFIASNAGTAAATLPWFFQNSSNPTLNGVADTLAGSSLVTATPGTFTWAGGTSHQFSDTPCAASGTVEAISGGTPPNGYCEIDLNYTGPAIGTQIGSMTITTATPASTFSLPLTATGLASLPAARPMAAAASQPLTTSSSITSPTAVARDPWGNLYFIGTNGSPQIYQVVSGTPTAISVTTTNATGLAFDAAGDLFFTASSSSLVKEATVASVTSNVPSFNTPATALTVSSATALNALLLDTDGDMYVSGTGTGAAVYKSVLLNGAWTSPTVIAGLTSATGSTGDGSLATAAKLNGPASLALDGAGNLYIADRANGNVRRVQNGVITTVASGLTNTAVALDAGGNLYIAGASGAVEVLDTPSSAFPLGPYTAVLASSLATPDALTIDGSGNLYIANFTGTGTALITEVSPPNSQGPDFGHVTVGSSSSAQTNSIGNLGNLSFTVTGKTNNSDFALALSPATGASCATSGVVTPGSSCTVAITFTPTASGSRTGAPTITTDNTTVPTVTLNSSGTGDGPTKLAFGVAPPATGTSLVALSPTITVKVEDANGNVVTTDSSTVIISKASGSGSLTGTVSAQAVNGVASFSDLLLDLADTYTLTASDGGLTPVTSGNVVIGPGAAHSLTVLIGNTANAGFANNFTVTALDLSGNVATGYTGIVTFTSTDTAALLPANYTFTGPDAGVHTFTAGATFPTVGTQTVTAADTVTNTITGTSGNVTVSLLTDPVGSTSGSLTAVVPVTASGTIVTLQGTTLGATTGSDFAATAGTCTGAVTSGNTCTVNVTFDPTAPGLRLGAAELLDGSGNVLGEAFFGGNGTGPMAAFTGQAATATTGFSQTRGMTYDGLGNLIITGQSGMIYKNDSTHTISTGTLSLSSPIAVAYDGGGNLYIADSNKSQLVELPAGAANAVLLGTSGDFSFPQGVAVDAGGNVYVADTGNRRIVRMAAGTHAETVLSLTGPGGSFAPRGIAIDANGNLYIPDSNTPALWKTTIVGGTAVDVSNGQLTSATSVAVDAAGNLYIADDASSKILELPAGGSSLTTLATPTAPWGVAVNANGNLAFDSNSGASVSTLDRHDAPTLSFANQNVSTTSASQTVGLTNLGNGATNLNVTALAFDANFPNQSSTCTTSTSLIPGASCNLIVAFDPQTAGTFSSPTNVLTLHDNSLNAAPATQTLGMSGIGVGPAAKLIFTVTPPATGTSMIALSPTVQVSVEDTNGVVVTSDSSTVTIAKFSGPGVLSGTVSVPAVNGVASFSNLLLNLVGTYTLQATDSSVAPVLTPATSGNVVISPGAAASFTVTTSANATASFANNVTVTALDAGTNVATGYTGIVTFTSTDTAALLPANYTFTGPDAGVHIFTAGATFPTVGTQTVTATDTVTNSITGTSGNVTVSLLTQPVGSTSASLTAVVPVTTSGTIVTLQGTTLGATTGSDFAATAGTCSGAVTSGNTCTVTVTFDPTAPGLRLGAAELLDGSGNLLGEAFFGGNGTGPMAAFTGQAATVLTSGINQPSGLTYDGLGNLIIASSAGATIYKNDVSHPISIGGVTLSHPAAVAYDGAGNLYIADYSNTQIIELPAGASNAVLIGSGLSTPQGLAVDAAGNLYVGDSGNGRVVKLAAGTHTQTVLSLTGPTGSFAPRGLAIDASGNLFIADAGTPAIWETTVAGGTATSLASGTPVTGATPIAVDAAGNVYFGSFTGSAVEELPVGGSRFVLASSTSPYGLAVSPNGNVVFSDFSDGIVNQIDQHDAPTLSFGNQNVLTTSATQTAGLTNLGNGATNLNVTALAFDANFPNQSSTCTTSTSLVPGGSCNLIVAFAPQTVNTFSAPTNVLGISDNSLNGIGAIQKLPMSGTGTQVPQAISFTGPGPQTYGVAPLTLSATGGGSGNPVVFSVLSGPGSVSGTNGTTLTVTGVGTIQVAADQAGNTDYSAAPEVTQSVVVSAAAVTITASSPAAITYGASAPTVTGTPSPALFGSDTLSSIGVTCSPAAITGVGTVATSCSGTPANYTVTYVAGSFTVNKAAVTITASNPAAITYGDAAPTVTGTPSPLLFGSDTLTSIGVTCSPAAITGVGTVATSCSGTPANYTVTYVAGSFTVNKAAVTITASSPAAITYGDAAPTVTGTPSPALFGSDTLTSIGVTCSPAAITGVGTVATSCSGTPANYTVTYVAGSFTVNKAAVTITASSPAAITYGDAAPTVTGTPSPALFGSDTLTSIGVTCSPAAITGVGTIATSCSGTPANYTVTYVAGSFTVNKAAVTITASSPAAITYGASAPTVTGTPSPLLFGSDTLTSIGVTCSPAAITGVGTVATTCSGTPANYTVTYVAGSFTVNKAAVTITASSPAAITYGASAPTVTGTPSPALFGSDTLTSIGVTCSPAAITGVGTVATSCSGTPANYTVTYVAGSFTVNKAAVTITASSPAAITYGDAAPTVTGTPSPLLFGSDTLTSIGVTCSPAAITGVGTVATTCSGTPANYTVTYVAGSFTVNKAAVTITASSPAAITYGASAPTVTGTPSPALFGSDTLTSIGVTCSPAAITGVGTVATSCSGTPANYTVTYVAGSFTVNKAAVTITASNPAAITYGDAAPTVTGTPSPALFGSDTLTSIGVTCSPAAITGVGTVATSCSGTPANYTVTYVAGSFTVNKAAVTITASSPAAITYGASAPTVTGTPSPALFGSDTLTSIGVTCSPAAITGVGTVATSCSGTPANYTVTYVAGSFTVNKAAVTITASSPAAITYGDAAPTVTGTPSPLLFGSDTLTSIGVTCSPAAITGVGTVATTCSGTPANYTVTYVAGSFTVNKAAVTITASSPAAITYGASAPTVTGTPSPLLFGSDTLTSIGVTCSPAAITGVGTIATSCSGTPANYTVTYVAGSFTVNKAAVTITASSPAAITYGASAPTVTGTPSPALFGSDTLTSIGVTCSPAAITGVGTVATTCSGTPANYTVTYVAGSFTVNKAAVTITASNPAAITYGDAAPTVTGTPSPLLFGSDTLTSIGVTCSPAAITGVGTVATSCSGTPANYTVTYVAGSFTVNKAAVTITASSPAAITYGDAAPTVTGTPSPALFGSDTLTSIGVTCSPAAITGVGTIATSCSGTPANYTVTYVAGSFTVNKAAVTITASSPAAITYGASAPTVTGTPSPLLFGSDTLTSIGVTCSPAAITGVGTVATTCSGTPANYTVTYVAGSFTVNKAAVTITASSPAAITYGASAPTVTGTPSPALFGSDTLTSIGVTCSPAAITGVGTVATSCSGTPANYTVTYVAGSFTVNKAAVTITASSPAAITYGASAPTVTGTPSPLLFGSDTLTSIGVTCSPAAITGVGTVATTCSGTPANYTVTYVAGSFTVNKAAVTITASSPAAITYGASAPTVTGTPSPALFGSDTLTSIGVTCSPAAITGVGTVATSCSGTPANYTVTYVAGSFTVNKAAVTITASNPAAITYGDAAPTVTGTPSPLLFGSDTLTSIGVTCSPAAITGVGTVATSCSGTPANYTVTYVAGSFTVNKAAVTITASSPAAITYGASAPTVTGTPSPLLFGSDTLTSIGVTCSPAAITGVGTVATTCSGTPANYTVTYVAGSFTVNKAAVTITASSPAAITYGASAPTVTGTPSPALFGSDTLTSIGVTCSPAAITGVGTVATSCSGTPANYTVTYVAGSFTVNKAAVTITASSPAAITYGDAAPTVTGTPSPALFGSDTLTSIGVTCSPAAITGVGTVATSCSGTPANYTVTYVAGSFTVNKAAVTITASSPAAITYGASAPTVTGTPSPALFGSDTLTSIGVTCSPAAITGVGTVATSCSGTPANYTVTYVAGSFTVNKAAVTITASSPAAITYGASAPTVTGTPSPLLFGSDTLTSIGVTCSPAAITGVGTVATSCSGTPANYTVTYVAGSFTVNKAAVTITASSPAAITYGDAAPTVTGTPSPALFGSDTLTSIGVTCSPAAITGVGTIATSCSGTPANYTVTYVAGSFTVNKAAVTITASSPAAITYGASAPTVTGTPSPLLFGSDTLTSIGVTCSPAAITGVGTVATSCSGTPANYTVTYVAGSFTVNKAAVTITASSPAAITYGDAAPTVTGTPSPALFGSDTLTSIGVTCSPAAITGVGTVATSCSGTPANYTVTYVAGSFTVNKAAVTITASSPAAITYGDAAPTVTGTPSPALFGSDTLTSIGVTCSPAAITGVGTIATSCSGTPANYTVTYVAGSFTVNKAAVTITASSPAAITYGASAPTVTGTPSPLLFGSDTLTSIGVTCSPAAITSVGTIATSCSGTPANYTVTYVAGSFTVNKAAVTITASSPAAITYGDAAPTVTGTPSPALFGSDTLTSIGVTCSPAAITSVGTIATSCSGTPANYTVTYTAGSFTVNPAPLTVTAQNATRAYGAANPTFTGIVSGLVNHDASTVVTGAAAFSTTAISTSDPGPYPITATAGTLSAANYTVSIFTPGTLTITKASQTITFAALANHNLTDAPFAIAATATSNLTVAFTVVSGPATVAGSIVTITGPGTVTIEADQTGNTDYSAAPAVQQSFSVVGATLGLSVSTVTFGSQPVNTTSAAQTVLVSNTSGGTLNITNVQAGGDFAAAANCASVPANGTCSISVTFTPTAIGARSSTLTITDNASGSPQTVSLAGTGTAPGVIVTPTSLVFGSQVVNTTSTGQTVTILNTGTGTLHVATITPTGDYAVTGNCAIVPAGTDCSFSVTFTPTATGTRTGTVTVTDDAGGGSQLVNLTGSGIAPGVSLTPATLTFADTTVGSSSLALTATLNNTGTAPLNTITIGAQGDFTQTTDCAATLGAGLSCNITVTFTPTVAGLESGFILVNDSLGQQTVALSGNGLTASASLSTGQLLFGGQLVGTSSDAQTVLITNLGTGDLTLGPIAPPASFSDTTNCGATLAAGASCSLNVEFAPVAAGLITSQFTFTAGSATETVSVQGTGVLPGLAIEPSFAIFGGQTIGSTSFAQTLTAVNTGTTALNFDFVNHPVQVSSDFAQTNECPATLDAGYSCLISVSFAPTALGTRSGSLTLTDSTGAFVAVAILSGQGTLPGVAVAPANVSFGSLTVGVASHAQTVTVSNIGSAPATITAVSSGGDFAETTNCVNLTLAPGANCVVSVTMTPSTLGTRTGTVQVSDSTGATHNIALSGFGQAAGINIFPTSLNFGSSPLPPAGSQVTLTGTVLSVTLTNVGNIPLDLDSYALTGDFNQTNNCPANIQPQATCTLSISFSPTALGNRTGMLTVTDNAGQGIQQVNVEGFGSPGGLTLTPPVLNFGTQVINVTSSAQQALLTNKTGEDLDNLVITPSGEYGETNTCGTTLANGANCLLNISVTPVALGDITGNVIVSGTLSVPLSNVHTNVRFAAAGAHPDDASANFSLGVVALTATAVPPGIGLSVPELSFSATAVGTASTGQTITLKNTGSGVNAISLTHLTISATNGAEFPFTTTCPATLAPQATCTITVNFDPAGAGLRSGFMNINADGGIFAQMPESGIGIGPQLTVAPSTLTYAARPVATTSTSQVLLLQNTGGLPLHLTGFTAAGDYHVTATTCTLPQTLAANATCTVSVDFIPSATGTRNSAITFASDSVAGSVVVALDGSSNTAGLTIAPLALPFGVQGVGVASAAKTVTFTNNNTGAIGITSIAIAPSANYSETNTCPASLAAGASCTVSVIFEPTATGEQDASLTVTDDAGAQTVALTGAGSDFTIDYAGTLPSAVTVDQGAQTTYHLGLTSVSGDNQTITLSCSASAGFSCAVSKTQVAIGSTPGTFDLVLTSNSRSANSTPIPVPSPDGGTPPWTLLALAFAAFATAVVWKRRRAGLSLAGASLLIVFSAACANYGQPQAPSTYYVTVNATSSTGATHSRTLDLVTK